MFIYIISVCLLFIGVSAIPKCPPVDSWNSVYFPDDDCTIFWQCSNGVAYMHICPGGLHFNPTLNVCDWPNNAGCSQNTTTDKPATVETTEHTPESIIPNNNTSPYPINSSTNTSGSDETSKEVTPVFNNTSEEPTNQTTLVTTITTVSPASNQTSESLEPTEQTTDWTIFDNTTSPFATDSSTNSTGSNEVTPVSHDTSEEPTEQTPQSNETTDETSESVEPTKPTPEPTNPTDIIPASNETTNETSESVESSTQPTNSTQFSPASNESTDESEAPTESTPDFSTTFSETTDISSESTEPTEESTYPVSAASSETADDSSDPTETTEQYTESTIPTDISSTDPTEPTGQSMETTATTDVSPASGKTIGNSSEPTEILDPNTEPTTTTDISSNETTIDSTEPTEPTEINPESSTSESTETSTFSEEPEYVSTQENVYTEPENSTESANNSTRYERDEGSIDNDFNSTTPGGDSSAENLSTHDSSDTISPPWKPADGDREIDIPLEENDKHPRDEEPLIPQTPEEICSQKANGIYFSAYPSDCTKFVTCASGIPNIFNCPVNQFFNPAINVCSEDRSVCG